MGKLIPSKDFLEKLVLIFISSFLFVGFIESYKNNESLNASILETYKNIKSKRSQCHKIHNEYFLSYYPYAGTLNIQGQELENIKKTNPKLITKEYEVWLNAIIDSQQDQIKEIENLKNQTASCYRELYIEYDDLAILLGVFNEYETIVSNRSSKINETYNSQKHSLKENFKYLEPDYILNAIRKGMSSTLTQDTRKLNIMFDELYNAQITISKFEEQRFNIELETYGKLRNIYLPKIKSRLERGFIGYILN